MEIVLLFVFVSVGFVGSYHCPGKVLSNCSSRQSDNMMIWSTYKNSNCFCGYMCEVFGDCCDDVTLSPASEKLRALNVDSEAKLAALRHRTKCKRIKSSYIMEPLPVYVITKCAPEAIEDDVKKLCEKHQSTPSLEDVLQQTPVTSLTTSVLYRNVFCAICNQDHQNVSYWEVSAHCEEQYKPENAGQGPGSSTNITVPMKELMVDTTCELDFKPPTITGSSDWLAFRYCKPVISECDPKWDESQSTQRGDQRSTSYVYTQRGTGITTAVYKNMYYATCNYMHRDNLTCHDPIRRPRKTSFGFKPVSFKILLDFNRGGGSVSRDIDRVDMVTKQCPDGAVYDVFHSVCRQLRCPPGLRLLAGSCVTELFSAEDSCALIALNQSEYTLMSNNSLYIYSMKRTIAAGQHWLIDDTYFICATNFTQNYTESVVISDMFVFSSVQGIVSLCGQAISLVSMLILFMTYTCFKSLRNVPGKCLMCLVVCLFLAQLSFLLGSFAMEQPVFCQMVAVGVHYFFVAAFCWMNVLAFDLWYTLHFKSMQVSRSTGNKRMCLYAAYAFLLPLALVTAALTLDLTESSVLRPYYGTTVCWFNDSQALLYLFALPLGVSLAANFILFTVIVYTIHQASRELKTIDSKSSGDRVKLVVYLKLAAIMGLTWVFGYLGAATNLEVLWYVFIVFNTLQGLFLCLAFVWNKKVAGLYSESVQSYEGMRKFSTSAATFFTKRSISTTSGS